MAPEIYDGLMEEAFNAVVGLVDPDLVVQVGDDVTVDGLSVTIYSADGTFLRSSSGGRLSPGILSALRHIIGDIQVKKPY